MKRRRASSGCPRYITPRSKASFDLGLARDSDCRGRLEARLSRQETRLRLIGGQDEKRLDPARIRIESTHRRPRSRDAQGALARKQHRVNSRATRARVALLGHWEVANASDARCRESRIRLFDHGFEAKKKERG